MEPEKCKKLVLHISFRWNGRPGLCRWYCILITALMVSCYTRWKGLFRESHSPPLSIFKIWCQLTKPDRRKKVMRLCSDPMDFIPYSVAWLVSSVRSWLLWKRCSFRHFNKWKGKDEIMKGKILSPLPVSSWWLLYCLQSTFYFPLYHLIMIIQ